MMQNTSVVSVQTNAATNIRKAEAIHIQSRGYQNKSKNVRQSHTMFMFTIKGLPKYLLLFLNVFSEVLTNSSPGFSRV